MDTVIDRLSEIEAAAGAITEEANARKKAFAEEMNAKTAVFDKNMEQETVRRIARIQGKMETDINRLLAKQKAKSEALSKELEGSYNRYREKYAEVLFRKMIRG